MPVKMVSLNHLTKVLIIFAIVVISSVNAIFIIEANTTRSKMKTKNVTPAEWTEMGDDGLWSEILEDWTLRYVYFNIIFTRCVYKKWSISI